MIAAVMTAANLGTRVTGWGFVVFTIGSLAWSIVALRTGQTNLLWTNGFLTAVNLLGMWRWLGRQARHEKGRATASVRSVQQPVPTLFGIGSVVGAALRGQGGISLGTVVDAMMQCDGTKLAYVVVSEGGVAGVGERLHALSPNQIRFSADGVDCDLGQAELMARPLLEQGNWPASIEQEPCRAEA